MIPTSGGAFSTHVPNCPRCGQEHVLLFETAEYPIAAAAGLFTHVAFCPVTGDLIGAEVKPPAPSTWTWLLCRGGELDGDRLPLNVVGTICYHHGAYELVEPDHEAPYYQFRDLQGDEADGSYLNFPSDSTATRAP